MGKLNKELDTLGYLKLRAISDDTLVEVWKKKKLIESFLNNVESYLYNKVEGTEDNNFHGLTIKPKEGNRTWKDELKVQKYFSDRVGNDMYNVKLKSPAQMEKTLKESGKKLKEAKVMVAGFSHRPITGEKLVFDKEKISNAKEEQLELDITETTKKELNK